MPSKSSPFTPSSILFRPRIQRTDTRCRITDKPFRSLTSDVRPLVEAPGTAPGSAGFITMAVYRHSRIAPTKANIGTSFADEKALPRSETALAASLLTPSRAGESMTDFLLCGGPAS